MRLLIATGIFEPDIGGPATYARFLADTFTSSGDDVTVVTLSGKASHPSDANYSFKIVRVVRANPIVNRLKLLIVAARHVWNADVVYSLDWFAVGFPIAVLSALMRKKYLVRVGGDYLWERHLEKGNTPCTLASFYADQLYKKPEYRSFYGVIRRVLSNAAHVVFNSVQQRELYVRYYDLDPHKVRTIENARPDMPSAIKEAERKEFVFLGRLVAMKNLESLVRAFAIARLPGYTMAIMGEGPQKAHIAALVQELQLGDRVTLSGALPRAAAWERLRGSRALIMPSWTDISPNQVLEALALGVPALVTKETYLSIVHDLPATIDPASVDDIAKKLEMLADDTAYRAFADSFQRINFRRSWDDVAREHRELFSQI